MRGRRGKRGEKIQVGCAEVERCGEGREKEERRRRPCVLHLIRLRLRAINYTRERERIYTQAGKHTLKSTETYSPNPLFLPLSHTRTHSAGYLSSVNELRLTDSSMSLTLILLRPA